MGMLIVVGILVVGAFYIVGLYNGLVKKRTLAEEGYSGIDVQLKRRADLIPNLVETVKGYMEHERGTLDDITALRTKSQIAATPDDKFAVETQISKALSSIMMVAENYPQLQASSNFNSLQEQLSSIEEQLQMARRYYNGAARDLNVMVEQFPSNMVAQRFGFQKKPFFEIENEADRAVQKVSFK